MATNKMDLVMEKCTEVTFRVKEKIFKLMDVEPQNSVTVKDLGIFLSNVRTSKKSLKKRTNALIFSQEYCNECANEDQTWTLEVLDSSSEVV